MSTSAQAPRAARRAARRLTHPALTPALTLAAGAALWALLFHAEAAAAIRVWAESTAYSHCALILPLAAFLAWDRRSALATIVLRPAPAFAAVLAIPAVLAWLAAERLGLMEIRQLAALALLWLLVLAVIGPAAWRAMAAPLLYLVFLVPFGAFITPALQRITLELTMLLLGIAGIPAVSDGLVIEVPHATFYVAEACAGLRFLVASVAFGALYACLIYRTPDRRAAFLAASVVIPVLANGVRAFGIVALGYLLGSAEAAAADHLIYGWVFFSTVILLLVLAGLPFRQNPGHRTAVTALPRVLGPRPWPAAALLLALAATGPAVASALNHAAGLTATAASHPMLDLSDCTRGTLVADNPDTATLTAICPGPGQWRLRVTLLPPRATPGDVARAVRDASGDLEDARQSPIPGPGGDWTLVEPPVPGRLTALATWRGGHLAQPGLSGRLAQARASLFGADVAPVVVALSWDGTGDTLSPTDMENAVARLHATLARQTAWPDAIARLWPQAR